ncbi:unnamed protein product [Clonostachys rhizophaga]|uniref:DNA-directed RNA polymerase subunit n=1 Tax=Clonostachys rhizophaga TaxID=160324 RepID=A0A9N9VV36_9HYPO|nr:unnamed protein product [Clonostachys rhizophaga]
MFILTKIADLVQIKAADFSKPSIEAIEDNINAKYANKVLQKIGLCVSLYDILWTSEGLIGHGTGEVNVNVEFRMIVFRPFKGEVMLGKISSSTPSGINLFTIFFNDIFIPFEELPAGSEYSHSDQLWVWKMDDVRLYYDTNEMVRFQVIDEEWHDQTPAGPSQAGGADEEENAIAPYKIKGSMAREGLGVCLWWDN